MKKMKKIISTISAISLLATMCVMPAANAEDGDAKYEVMYDLSYENISSDTTNCWDYVNGNYGTRQFIHTDGFSGDTSIEFTTNNDSYRLTDFIPCHGWNGTAAKIELTQGETYIMSFKVKKIVGDARLHALRDQANGNAWIWGQRDKFKPSDTGWKTVSHTFTVGETYSTDGSTFTTVPVFCFTSSTVAGEAILLIDDFRTVHINDTSILTGTDPTAEVSEISANAISVTFSQEMMESDETYTKA